MSFLDDIRDKKSRGNSSSGSSFLDSLKANRIEMENNTHKPKTNPLEVMALRETMDKATIEPDFATLEAQSIQGMEQPKKSNAFIDIQKKVYENTLEPLQDFFNRIAAKTVNEATLNVTKRPLMENETLPENIQKVLQPPETTSEKTADVIGTITGNILPGAAAYKTGGKLALKGVQKIAPNSPKLTQKFVEGAGAGLTYGLANEGLDAAIDTRMDGEQTAGQRAGNIALDTLLGGGIDVGLYGAGKGIKRIYDRYKNGDIGKEEFIENVSQSETPKTDSISQINPSPNYIPTYKDEFESAVQEEFQRMKGIKNNPPKPLETGGYISDQFGDVTSRYGTVSGKPEWLLEFERANNRRSPNNDELKQMAQDNLLNGFQDIGGKVPSWKPKAAQELEDEINSIREIIENETDEQVIGSLVNTVRVLEDDYSKIMNDFESQVKKPNVLDDVIPQKQATNINVLDELDAIFGKSNGKKAEGEKLHVLNNNTANSNVKPKVEPLKPIGEGTGDAASFRSKVNRPNNSIMQKIKDAIGKAGEVTRGLRSQFVDDLAALEKVEKDLTGGIASAEDSIYKQGRLFRGSPAKAHEIVRTELAPIINSVQSKGFSAEDLGDYALAVHAKDVNKLGIESGFTNQEIDDVISKFSVLEGERTLLNQISKNLLNNLSDEGVISKELVQHLNEKYPNYMPLFRHFDDEAEFAGGLSKALANVKAPLEKLKGSKRDVIDPIESMIKNIFKSTNAADRNRVASQITKLAEKDAEGSIIRKLSSNENVDRKNVVTVLENGKKVKYEVPADVYRAMLNLDQESSNLLIKILQKPASLLRAGATLTPEFSMRNWIRDVPTAFITSKSGFNPLIDFPVGLANAIGKGRPIKLPIVGQIKWNGKDVTAPGKWYHDFVMNNGGYGNVVSMDRKVHQEALEKVLKEPASKKFVNIINPKAWYHLLQTIADMSETATKVGEFRAAVKKAGVSQQEAAYRARDVMDFGRAGNSIREANKVIAFLNANIQGKSKLYRAFQEDKAGVTARSIVALTLPTIGVYYLQREVANDEQKKIIEDAPDWLKNSFWLVPVPMTNQVARIPKPFDLAPIFANLPEKMMEEHFNNNPQDWNDFVKDSLSTAAIPVMLTGLAPFIEGMANYSFFRQGSIIPQREDNLNFPDQYDINTSEIAKFTAKGVNQLTGGEGPFRNFGSPRIIDNTIQGVFGGLGNYGTAGIDELLKGTEVVREGAQKPDKTVSQMPLLKAFLTNTESTGQSMSDLYEEKERLTRAKGSAKEMNLPFNDAKLKYLESRAKAISDINKQMRLIQEDPDLDGATKRQKLQELNAQRNEIARQTMAEYKKQP